MYGMRVVATLVVIAMIGTATTAPAIGLDEQQFGYYMDSTFRPASGRVWVLEDGLERRLTAVGQRVAAASGSTIPTFTFRVVNDRLVNAYGGPGGFIYVTTGLLDVLSTEEELAAILAHEVVHSVNSHLVKGLEAARNRRIAATALSLVLAVGIAAATGYGASQINSPLSSQALMDVAVDIAAPNGPFVAALGDGIATALIHGYSRSQELEADTRGVHYLHAAGYDPRAMLRVFRALRTLEARAVGREGGKVHALVSDDVGLDEREAAVERELRGLGQPAAH